ncbi:hypothetical protein Tco_0379225 [Tanacetum coccineum]
MCLADSLIATLKVKIEAQRVHPTKIEKITRFPTHTPSVTPETLKPTTVHRVSMISKIKPTIYRTPHQHLTSNLKILILHSFEENKLEYEDEDEVEIKMMGTGMDKESLEHNLYEKNMTPIICHNFYSTSNPPIKPKDSGNFRMKIVKPLTIHTPLSPPHGILLSKWLYLMRRSLEVLRKFHWMILGGRFNHFENGSSSACHGCLWWMIMDEEDDEVVVVGDEVLSREAPSSSSSSPWRDEDPQLSWVDVDDTE